MACNGVCVLLEGVLVFHNACSAFFIPHLDKNCSKVRVRGVGTGLGRQLSNCLDDVSVDVNARGTDLAEHLPHHVKVGISCGGEGKESHGQPESLGHLFSISDFSFYGLEARDCLINFNFQVVVVCLF